MWRLLAAGPSSDTLPAVDEQAPSSGQGVGQWPADVLPTPQSMGLHTASWPLHRTGVSRSNLLPRTISADVEKGGATLSEVVSHLPLDIEHVPAIPTNERPESKDASGVMCPSSQLLAICTIHFACGWVLPTLMSHPAGSAQ